MKRYYKYSINRQALPWMFQIIKTGFRHPDRTGWDSAGAVVTIGYSKRSKKFVFNWKGRKAGVRT